MPELPIPTLPTPQAGVCPVTAADSLEYHLKLRALGWLWGRDRQKPGYLGPTCAPRLGRVDHELSICTAPRGHTGACRPVKCPGLAEEMLARAREEFGVDGKGEARG